MLGSARDV